MLDNDAPRNEYIATAGQTTFAYTFRIYASSDIKVYATASDAEAIDATDQINILAVSGVNSNDGGTVTVAAQTAGTKITIVQALEYERLSDYVTSGDFSPANVNKEFDRMISLIKQTGDELRGIRFERSQQGVSDALIDAPEANAFLRWNADGTRIINTTTAPSGGGGTGGVESVSGDGVSTVDPANPVITSVVTLAGDQVLATDTKNPKILPQVIHCTNTLASSTYTFVPVGSQRTLPADQANMNGVILSTVIAEANTGAASIAIDGMTTRAIHKDGNALSAGDIEGFCLFFYNHANTRWDLLFSSSTLLSTDDYVTTDEMETYADEGDSDTLESANAYTDNAILSGAFARTVEFEALSYYIEATIGYLIFIALSSGNTYEINTLLYTAADQGKTLKFIDESGEPIATAIILSTERFGSIFVTRLTGTMPTGYVEGGLWGLNDAAVTTGNFLEVNAPAIIVSGASGPAEVDLVEGANLGLCIILGASDTNPVTITKDNILNADADRILAAGNFLGVIWSEELEKFIELFSNTAIET